jgi:16S rRNA (uracil1498-N3)-methyltransferase
MSDRFFCSNINAPSVVLTDAEAHHAIHVMRLKKGDGLQLFDGAGTSADAEVLNVGRRDLTVSILATAYTEPSATGRITVAACVPKGDRLKWMIEKLTEVGVDRYIPLQTQRSVVDPGKSKLDKLPTTIVAASKQCRRDWLMEIGIVQTLDDLVNSVDDSERLFIAHPGDLNTERKSDFPLTNKNVTVLIGPEGGFTADEVTMARQKSAEPISWPTGILRTETAAIVMATLVMLQR